MSEACSVSIRFSCVNYYHDERPFWHHLLCYLLTATLSTSTYAIVSVTWLGRCKCHNCMLLLELHYKQQWQFTWHEPILINYSMSDQNRLYLLPHMLWAIFRNGYVNKKIISKWCLLWCSWGIFFSLSVMRSFPTLKSISKSCFYCGPAQLTTDRCILSSFQDPFGCAQAINAKHVLKKR